MISRAAFITVSGMLAFKRVKLVHRYPRLYSQTKYIGGHNVARSESHPARGSSAIICHAEYCWPSGIVPAAEVESQANRSFHKVASNVYIISNNTKSDSGNFSVDIL